MADALAHIHSTGKLVEDAMIALASPVGWEHIAFAGDFLWERALDVGHGKGLSSLTEREQPEHSVPVYANLCSAGNQRDALSMGDVPWSTRRIFSERDDESR